MVVDSYEPRLVCDVAGLIAFWDEKVDVYLDGVRQDRPETLFS